MAMTSMADRVTGGVDTHLDVHVAAALDRTGALLGTASSPASAGGCRKLLSWLRRFGDVELVGVEGAGSYGAGLTRYLRTWRSSKSSGPTARTGGAGASPTPSTRSPRRAPPSRATPLASPEARDGNVESMRVLRLAKLPARTSKTMALNQMRSIVATGPEELRAGVRDLPAAQLVERALALRPGGKLDTLNATKIALRQLARSITGLDAEISAISTLLEPLVTATAPELLACNGVGPDVAAALLIAAGDNPERLGSERSFAKLCGVAPLDASPGKQQRHRFSRAGDRQANSALWGTVMTRIV
jgi:transposase